MTQTAATPPVGATPAEATALRALALTGALSGPSDVTCEALGEALDASAQTASRRLQALAEDGLIEREHAGPGQRVTITEAGERVLRREYEAYQRVFEAGRDEVELDGTVTAGMGEGRHYISLPGYMAQFREKLGYEPFPGTLNVDLSAASVRRRSAMDAFDPVPIEGWEDEDRTYGPAGCYPAVVETTDGDRSADAHVIVPERTHHDADQIEVIAPVKLRDTLGLEDAQQVTIHVLDE
jgi:riboflavin kinase